MAYEIERKFEQKSIEHFDFSYKIFKNCFFEDCKVENKDFTNSIFQNCRFTRCEFKNCNFQSASFQKSGKWINCSFTRCDFSKVIIDNLKVDTVAFSNNYINKTVFNGTELIDVVFEGKLSSSWFFGIPQKESLYAVSFFAYKKAKALSVPTINFEKALLQDVVFSRSLDLSKTKFPEHEQLIIIKNPSKFFANFLTKVKQVFADASRRNYCKELVDNFLFTSDRHNMPIIVVDLDSLNLSQDNMQNRLIIDLLKGN